MSENVNEKDQSTEPKTSSKPRPVPSGRAPDYPPAERRNWLIHMQYIQKDYDSCELLIKEQLSETGYNCEYALYVLGLICRQKGRLQDSLSHFQQCVLLNGGHNIYNFNQVAKTLFLMGRVQSAIEVYTDALKLATPGNDWEIQHNLGLCYMQLHELDKAKEHFISALSSRKSEQSEMMLGKISVILNNYEEAATHLENAAVLTSENADILSSLGMLYKDSGESNRAFEKLGSALSIDSSHVSSIVAVGSIIQQHGDWDIALNKYRTAASNAAENGQIWSNIGMAFFAKKKYVAAISCLARSFYLCPFEWRISYNLGLVYCHTQQYASAFRFLSSTLQLIHASNNIPKNKNDISINVIQTTSTHPSNIAEIIATTYMMLGICLIHLEDADNAEQAYFEAMKSSEIVSPLILYNYAIFLYQHKRYKDVGKYIKKIMNFDNTNFKDDENDSNQYREILKACKSLETLVNVGSIDTSQSDRHIAQPEPVYSTIPDDATENRENIENTEIAETTETAKEIDDF